MSYKISETSNKDNLIELLLVPLQARSHWLNVQIDQRNPKNLVVKVKTADEKSYILLAPFLNSHKDVPSETVERDLAQFIAGQNYGIALVDRRVIRLDGQAPQMPLQLQKKVPVIVPKHMMEQSPKKAQVPGGKELKKEIIQNREAEDAGLMAFGSEKRAEVLKMLQGKGVGYDVVQPQPKVRAVPKLAAQSRLLNNAAPNPNPNPNPAPSPLPAPMRSPLVEPVLEPIDHEHDEDLDFAIALSLQDQAEPIIEPKRYPSPPVFLPRSSVAPSPNPVMPNIPPFNPELARSISPDLNKLRLELDAAYAASLAEELEQEEVERRTSRRNRQEIDMLLAVQIEAEETAKLDKQTTRREHLEKDMLLAAQIEAEEKLRLKEEHERLSQEMIERLRSEEAAFSQNPDFQAPEAAVEKEQIDPRQIACEAFGISLSQLEKFERIDLPALDTDAHVANKNFVRNARQIVNGLFEASHELKTFYDFASKAELIDRVRLHLSSQIEYKNDTYKKAIGNVFGPYARLDKEEKETGGVSLKDMLVRIYILLEKNAELEAKEMTQSRAFLFLKQQMTDQANTCFEGGISRMFAAYWGCLWYYYDNLIGLKPKEGFYIEIPQ